MFRPPLDRITLEFRRLRASLSWLIIFDFLWRILTPIFRTVVIRLHWDCYIATGGLRSLVALSISCDCSYFRGSCIIYNWALLDRLRLITV